MVCIIYNKDHQDNGHHTDIGETAEMDSAGDGMGCQRPDGFQLLPYKRKGQPSNGEKIVKKVLIG